MKIKLFYKILAVLLMLLMVSCKTAKTETSKDTIAKDNSDKPHSHETHAEEVTDSLLKKHVEELKKGEMDITLEPKKQYNFKSGIIEMSNTMISGMKQTIYFDNYGEKKATYVDAPAKEGMPTSRTVIIEDKGMITVYYEDSKSGTRTKAADAQIGVLTTIAYVASNMTPELTKEFDIKQIEDFIVLDKKCKGYSMIVKGVKSKVWVWERIPLYIQAQMGGDRTIVAQASSVKTDVPVPNTKFIVPKGIIIEDMD